MKKYIAMLLVFASLTLSACSSAPSEDTDAVNDTAAETVDTTIEETQPETDYVRPEDEEYVDYRSLHLASDPVYHADTKTLVLYFEDYEIWYPEDAACDVAYVSDLAANSIPAKPDMTSYPDMKLENGDYKGVALVLDEAIPTGTHEIYVSFSNYSCNFEMTIQ